MLRKEYVRQYRQGAQQGQENTVLLLLQNTVTPTGHGAASVWNIEQTEIQQICGEGYLRYGQ